jgi:Pentapeptide repeats (8 copies)
MSVDQRKPVEASPFITYADVVSPFVTSFAFFLGGPMQRLRHLLGNHGLATGDHGSRTDRMVAAVRRLGVEKTFRQACKDAARWSWKIRGTRLPARLPLTSELDARIEAIEAIEDLEAMSREEEENLVPVMEALCAFVRQNCEIEAEAEAQAPRKDVQRALEAVGRLGQGRAAPLRAEMQICRANLMLSMLTLVRLPEARLSGADLTGARLDYANLSGAVLSGASLIAVRLKGADLSNADLTGAECLGAYLEIANLEGARLENANLSHATLAEARLHGACLSRANLDGWSCERASLRGADLTDVRNLDRATLLTSYGVRSGPGRTILPQGVEPPRHWYEGAERDGCSAAALNAYEARYHAWLAVCPGHV